MRHRRLTIIIGYVAAISTFLMAVGKMVLGIYSQATFKNGLVVISAGVSSLVIAFCKLLIAREIDADEKAQIRTYRFISWLFLPVAIFFFVSNLIAKDDPISDYGLALDIGITVGLVVLFAFSIRGIFKMKEKSTIARSGKVISFVVGLTNLVVIEHLFEYQLMSLFKVEVFNDFKVLFSMSIASIILLIGLFMFIYSFVKMRNFRRRAGMID